MKEDDMISSSVANVIIFMTTVILISIIIDEWLQAFFS